MCDAEWTGITSFLLPSSGWIIKMQVFILRDNLEGETPSVNISWDPSDGYLQVKALKEVHTFKVVWLKQHCQSARQVCVCWYHRQNLRLSFLYFSEVSHPFLAVPFACLKVTAMSSHPLLVFCLLCCLASLILLLLIILPSQTDFTTLLRQHFLPHQESIIPECPNSNLDWLVQIWVTVSNKILN